MPLASRPRPAGTYGPASMNRSRNGAVYAARLRDGVCAEVHLYEGHVINATWRIARGVGCAARRLERQHGPAAHDDDVEHRRQLRASAGW